MHPLDDCENMTSPYAKAGCRVRLKYAPPRDEPEPEENMVGWKWYAEDYGVPLAWRNEIEFLASKAAREYGIATPRVRFLQRIDDEAKGLIVGRFWEDPRLSGMVMGKRSPVWLVTTGRTLKEMLATVVHEVSHLAGYTDGGTHCAYQQGKRWREILMER